MPKRDNINKILIIGSGPAGIGRTSEWDSAAAQAADALRRLGCQVVGVNSDPASWLTDPDRCDAAYTEPLTLKVLKEIIDAERPDALLPTMGGDASLELTGRLNESGILEQYNISLIGVPQDFFNWYNDRQFLKQKMDKAGIDFPDGRPASQMEQAADIVKELGYPAVVRPSSGRGVRFAFNIEELSEAVARGGRKSRDRRVIIEPSLAGWQEFETILIRDSNGRTLSAGTIEQLDPMGIHPGDSISVIPPMTISEDRLEKINAAAVKAAEVLDLTGAVHFSFACDPQSGRMMLTGLDLHASASLALAVNATGIQCAYLSALISAGLNLDELIGATLPSSDDAAAVSFPLWNFESFEEETDQIGPETRSVGQALGMGSTFKEALLKAVRALHRETPGLRLESGAFSPEECRVQTSFPSSQRMFVLYETLKNGCACEELSAGTGIHPEFIQQIKALADLENSLEAYDLNSVPDDLLVQAKKDGFSDRWLGQILGCPESEIRTKRAAAGLTPGRKLIPLVWKKGLPAPAVQAFSTYAAVPAQSETPQLPGKTDQAVLILGDGPNKIGESVEIGYHAVLAAEAVHKQSAVPLLLQSNANRLLSSPDLPVMRLLDPIDTEEIAGISASYPLKGVIPHFGGSTVRSLLPSLREAGIPLMGDAPKLPADEMGRKTLYAALKNLGIPHPKTAEAGDLSGLREAAQQVGFPLIIRCRNQRGGKDIHLVLDAEELKEMEFSLGETGPFYLQKFLENAIEADADVISDGKHVFVPTIIEHIERAGVHAGDSASVTPPLSIAARHIETMRDYTRRIASHLEMSGPLYIQFAIFTDTVYVFEVSSGASRTVPMVSKTCQIPMINLSVRTLMGASVSDLNLQTGPIAHFGVKEAVFPFYAFDQVDPLLGLTMKATGSVLGLSHSFGRAFFKSQEAAGSPLPVTGTVLFTISDKDKPGALEAARLFADMGFDILTTKGTRAFFKENGIASSLVKKLGYGRPNIVDAVKSGQVDLVINTPVGRQSQDDDSYIRKASIQYGVPNITTIAATVAAARGIAARRKGKPKIRSLQAYSAVK